MSGSMEIIQSHVPKGLPCKGVQRIPNDFISKHGLGKCNLSFEHAREAILKSDEVAKWSMRVTSLVPSRY